jgi:DNA-binding response OmpR family regulator
MVVELGEDEQRTWIQTLRETLAAIDKDEDPGLILVMGTEAVAASTARLGLDVKRVEKMEQALQTFRDEDVRLVVFQEGTDGLEGADVVGQLAQFAPELGVFVIADRTSTDKVVRAIGIGVTDYLLVPVEGHGIYEARLRRLIARQQDLDHTRRILDALKKISIDLLAPPPSSLVAEDRF